MSRIWLAGLLMVAAGGPAGAHEVRPGYLGIRSTTADRYQVVWKQPALGEMCVRIDPVFPADCALVGERLALRSAREKGSPRRLQPEHARGEALERVPPSR